MNEPKWKTQRDNRSGRISRLKMLVLCSVAIIVLFQTTSGTPQIINTKTDSPDNMISANGFSSSSSLKTLQVTHGKSILIASPVTFDNMTIPVDSKIQVRKGGRIIIPSDKTLLICGKFEAGLFQVFAGDGKVLFAPGSIKSVFPEWFGAKGDGLVDSTQSIQKAVDSLSKGTISLSSGVYAISDALKLLNKTDIKIVGKESTVRQTNTAKELVHISGSSNVTLKDLTLYGVLETAGPIGTENAIRIDPNLPGTANHNSDIFINNIVFKQNGLNAIYMGADRSPYGRLSNVKVTDCKMEYGLSFMLAVGVKNLMVNNINIVHRNTAPVGAGISQDEDIAVIAANGISCENVIISNVVISAMGSAENAFTGHAKLDFAIAERGLTFKNLHVSNIMVKDNLGKFTPTYGTDGSTMYISDVNPERKGFINARFSDITFVNSPGIFIEANNLKFNNISLTNFPSIPGWKYYGRAIDSNQAISTGGCIFNNVSINGWYSSPSIYTAEGGVLFNNLKVRNSTGSVWAGSNSIYNNMIMDNVSDIDNGAFYVSGNSNNIVINNSVFRNNTHTALKENENHRSIGSSLVNTIFKNNGSDTNIDMNHWDMTNSKQISQSSNTIRNVKTHRIIGDHHFWIDGTGRLRMNNKAPLTDTDGTEFDIQIL